MQTIQADFYDYPRYYDLVYGSDWKAEFDFLTGCFERFAEGEVRRVFEPACGTGRLLFRLGKAGYEVQGIDLNSRAVAYCNRRLKKHGIDGAAEVGDMASFRLPRKVDAAFNTINSFRHLLSEDAALAHLQCVAQALRKGGIYVLGLHLTPTAGEATEEESWSARRGNLCVNTHMRLVEQDLSQRAETYSICYDVYTPTQSFRLQNEVVFRTYTAEQFDRLLASVAELEACAAYDFAYDLKRPINVRPETEDVVLVLQRR